jgi:ATP-dependent helicase YprA (DUF1998 family)
MGRMFLVLLLISQQCLSSSSYATIKAVPSRSVVSLRERLHLTALNGAVDDTAEFFPLGDVNAKSTIDRDTFLFGEKVTFASCGIGAELTAALEATGKFNPTSIQAKTFTAIATGRDVIVGAETGSGKTLSYLLPIIQGLLNEKPVEEVEEGLSLSMGSYPSAIIMVPNKELCSQVYRMANELINNMPQEHNISVGKLFIHIL